MGMGDDRERQLRSFFYVNAQGAIRFGGSGSAPKHELPDVLGKTVTDEEYAMEAKYTSGDYARFGRGEIKELIEFAEMWGAEPLLVASFSHYKYQYWYVNAEDALEEMPDSNDSMSIKRSERDELPMVRELLETDEIRRPDKVPVEDW